MCVCVCVCVFNVPLACTEEEKKMQADGASEDAQCAR